MDDHAEGVHALAVQQDVEPRQVALAVADQVVVEAAGATGQRLQLLVEVEHHLGERQVVSDLDPATIDVMEAAERAAPLVTQLLDAADVLRRAHDPKPHVRLLDPLDLALRRHARRVLHLRRRPVPQVHPIVHVGHRAHQIEVELPLQALPHDLHVQQTEKPATEAETQRLARLRLVPDRRVVQLQLVQCDPQPLVLVRVGRVKAREHHRLDLSVARQQLEGRPVGVEQRVAHLRIRDRSDLGREIPDFPRAQLGRRHGPQPEVADLADLVHRRARPERDPHPRPQHAVHDPDQRHRALVVVVL